MTYPKCPHCKYEFDAEDIWHTGSTEFPKCDDGETKDTLCLNCEAPLRIMLSITPTWIFLDEDDNELNQD